MGEPSPVERAGLLVTARDAPGVVDVRSESCFAVIPAYLEASDPGVNFAWVAVVRPGVVVGVRIADAACFARIVGGALLGVLLPVWAAGVTRPVLIEGVIRPLDRDADGVLRPLAKADGRAGVTRPFRVDATEEGRETYAVGGESLLALVNTPQLGGQTKYCFLEAKA